MTLSRTLTTTIVFAACVAAGAAWAQSGSNDRSAGKVSRADTAFLKQAAENGHAEVESSKLALQKAPADSPIHRFAQTMVTDHQRSGEELKALAATKGVQVPSQPSALQRGKLKMLASADGEKFSSRYIESMGVQAHQDTVKLFEKAAKQANDADVKAFAVNTLPTLRQHLTMAHELHGQKSEQDRSAKGSTGGNTDTTGTGAGQGGTGGSSTQPATGTR